jgi:hypothetical protein
MIQGQQGGDFAPNGYQYTIDEEFELGPTQEDFITPTESGPNPVQSRMYPQSPTLTNQYTNPKSRIRPGLGMSPDLENKPVDDGNFQVTLPEVSELREQWQRSKAINIPNIFPELQANSLHQYYYNQPDEWWDLVMYPDPQFDYEQAAIDNPGYYHMYKAEGNELDNQVYNHITQVNHDGGFSYTYRRTGDITQQKHPYLEIFESPSFTQFLSGITGHENLEFVNSHAFISNYETGHYNGPHTDGNNGRIAFVFHMSKDWKPQYGGLFMRMEWDWKTINKAICPPFNTLSIFDVSNGAPHLVSEVAQGVNNKRISYTGWYQ